MLTSKGSFLKGKLTISSHDNKWLVQVRSSGSFCFFYHCGLSYFMPTTLIAVSIVMSIIISSLPMWAGKPSLCSGPQHKWLCPLKFHRKWTPNILCLFLILDPNILFFSLLGLFSFCFNYHYLERCWFFSIAPEKYMYVCLYSIEIIYVYNYVYMYVCACLHFKTF